MKFVNFLKSRLIFNIFYCFWMFVNKCFTYVTCAYLRKEKVFNVKSSTYCFQRKTKILTDFQFCISVPLTKNIVMAAPIVMNLTLDNAGVLDPLLKFIFKNWDVPQFIILLTTKKLPSITIHFHNFLVSFLWFALLFWFFCFLFTCIF